jgi:hypothetical protein
MKLSRKDAGVITMIFFFVTEKRASAAAIAEHVFPEPRP